MGIAGDPVDPFFDLVGNVGDNLDGAPFVVAPPLFVDHRLIDAAGGDVVELRHVGVGKSLIVPQVQVGLGPVIGDKDFPMLVRAHGAGIHVDIGIQLDDRDGIIARLEQPAQTGGHNSFADAGDHAPRDEHKLGHGSSQIPIQLIKMNPTQLWHCLIASPPMTSGKTRVAG